MKVSFTSIHFGFGIACMAWILTHLVLIAQYGVITIKEENTAVLYTEIAGMVFFMVSSAYLLVNKMKGKEI